MDKSSWCLLPRATLLRHLCVTISNATSREIIAEMKASRIDRVAGWRTTSRTLARVRQETPHSPRSMRRARSTDSKSKGRSRPNSCANNCRVASSWMGPASCVAGSGVSMRTIIDTKTQTRHQPSSRRTVSLNAFPAFLIIHQFDIDEFSDRYWVDFVVFNILFHQY